MEPGQATIPMSPDMPAAGPEIPPGTGEPQAIGGPAPLSFTPDQVQSLIGGPAEPGKEYTVTIVAGDAGPDGTTSFEVVQSPAEGGLGEGLAEALPSLGEDEEKDDPAVTAALGYDRAELNKSRKKSQAPKPSAKDLED